MKSTSPSDREKADLRGPVKTMIDEWSATVFDRDGKILEWRGSTSHGHSERTYCYDENGRLIRITGSKGDDVDEFRYDEQGRMTQIRHVPERPERRNGAIGTEIVFEAICEGDTLIYGGTVETSYNEHGHPIERRVVDEEGTLLYRIDHTYGAKGRLAQERLVTENLSLPKAFREQIPSEEHAALLAQIRTEMESASQRAGLFSNAERTYVYNDRGQLVETHLRIGPLRLDVMRTVNDRGDMIEMSKRTSGIPREFGGEAEMHWKCRYSYEYDEHGNWTSRSETWEITGDSGDAKTQTLIRHLTYH